MKKILLMLTFLSCAFFATFNVEAETVEVNLNELEYSSFIIGYRIFDATYEVNVYDIVQASTEYTNKTGTSAPIYLFVQTNNEETNFLLEYTGPVDPETGVEPTKTVKIDDVFEDGVIDATSINNTPTYDYIKEVIEPDVVTAVETLNGKDKETGKNVKANKDGFESIVYDPETHTVTFTILDPSRDLASYQSSGIVELFLAAMPKADSIEYRFGESFKGSATKEDFADEKTANATVIEIAYKLLNAMAGKDAKELNYASVAGKEASATIKVNYGGFDYEETYTVKFVYDVKAAKDKELTEAAKTLSGVENATAIKNGFESIIYDAETNTGTFTILAPSTDLANYQTSGIVELFLAFIKDAEKIEYSFGNDFKGSATKEDFADEKTANATVIEIAYKLLSAMAGDDADELNYASVANKEASATVTYLIGGEEVTETYTVEFVYDVKAAKDKELTEAAETLNGKDEETGKNVLANKNGFESIVYDAETNTGTFTILTPSTDLANYQTSGIVELFLAFIKDAEKIEYSFGDNFKGSATKEDFADEKTANATVIEIAYKLLSAMAGDDADELNYAAVANKEASATVTYLIGGETITETYTVEFVYDVKAAKDKELTEAANTLNGVDGATAKLNGFESIVYDAGTKTGTFTILEPSTSLANYQTSGIVELFLAFINDAEKIEYSFGDDFEGSATKEDFADEKTANATVIEIAYKLLSAMAGDDAEELNYGAVANKDASATVTYLIGGEEVTETYTVSFRLAATAE